MNPNTGEMIAITAAGTGSSEEEVERAIEALRKSLHSYVPLSGEEHAGLVDTTPAERVAKLKAMRTADFQKARNGLVHGKSL